MINPLHDKTLGKVYCWLTQLWVEIWLISPIFFCLETPGQHLANTWTTPGKLNAFLPGFTWSAGN